MPSDRDRSMVEELRQKICELREKLEQEQAKNKQILHDKVIEIRHIKEQEQIKWEKERNQLKKKYLKEKNDAVNKIIENLKKKDKGFGDLLSQKDDEIRMLHAELMRENDACSSSSFNVKDQETNELRDQFETEKARLMQSMFELRTEKIRLEEELDIIKDADREKAVTLRQIHDQHQREIHSLKRSSAVENRKQLEEMRQIERRVMDKEKELSRKNKRLSQMEVSKEELQDKLNEQKLTEQINMSMSMIDLNSSFSPRKAQDDREKGLQQRNTELCTRIKQLEEKMTSLGAENEALVCKLFKERNTRIQQEQEQEQQKLKEQQQIKEQQQLLKEQQQKQREQQEKLQRSSSPAPNRTRIAQQEGRKRRLSLSTICANLEEKNQELSKQNEELLSEIERLKECPVSQPADDGDLAEKLKLQEKEKLLIERTLSQLLAQSNIQLPPSIRENIENQALQMELNEAVQYDNSHLVEQLRSKIIEQEEELQKTIADNKNRDEQFIAREKEICGREEQSTIREQELSTREEQISAREQEFTAREEMFATREQGLDSRENQLASREEGLSAENDDLKHTNKGLEEQLSATKAVIKALREENEALKQTAPLPAPQSTKPPDVDRKTRDMKNEIEMLRAEKQKLLDGEAATKQKIKLLEEVQMELVKKEEKNSRFYDEVSQKLSLVTQERNELSQRVEEYETQRRYEAEEMASMLNDRNDYLTQLEKDKEYLRKECENYRLSNVNLETRLHKMEANINPNNTGLINRIAELEEKTEVVDALMVSNEDLKKHIRDYEAEKIAMKKQHNEELQRVIRTLDKKNKEHNQKSEELRSHIKRLESDLRNLEQSKIENSGNLQIKSQELQQMSEYVKQLENTEEDLRAKLELYQKTTQDEMEGLKERNRALELNTKKMTDMRQTERVLRRHIIEIDKARASEARQHHRAKLQIDELKKKLEASEAQLSRTKDVDSLVQEVVMLQASEERLKTQLQELQNGKDVDETVLNESKSKDEELQSLRGQVRDLNKKLDRTEELHVERNKLSQQLDRQEIEHKDENRALRADIAKLEVKVQDSESRDAEQRHLIGRLEKEVTELSGGNADNRKLLEKIVELEEQITNTLSENAKLSTQMDKFSKSATASLKSVELVDGQFAEVHCAIATKINEQGAELSALMKNIRQLITNGMKDGPQKAEETTPNRHMSLMQNLETMSFIIKETMSLDQMMETLEKIYSRDLQKLDSDKANALAQVEDLKASIVEMKLTEVDNEFSTYPAALSVELRQLNNKLAMAEDTNRSLTQEVRDAQEQLQIKRDQAVLMETRLNDAEHKLAGLSDRSSEINSQANADQAEARHKSVKQKLQSEIDMLESSLETAHATIRALQSQLPPGSNDEALIQQVQQTQEKTRNMQAEYRSQLENLEVNLSTQGATLVRRDSEIKMMREQLSNMEGRLERASIAKEQDITAARLEKERHALANQKLETQNIELVTLCETIKGDFEKTAEALRDTEVLNTRLQHELKEREVELDNYREKVGVLEEKLGVARTELSAQGSHDALLQSKDQQINDMEEKLNEQSEKFQAEASKLKSEAWQLQTDIAAEKANKKTLEAKVAEMKLKLENSNASYERELDNSKEKLNASQSDLLNLNKKYENMSMTSDNLAKKVRELEYEVESKTREISDLREHCSELDKTVKQRNMELERFIKKTEDLDKELSVRRNATDVNSELSELLLNKDNHIQEIEHKLQSSSRDLVTTKAELSELRKKIGALEEDRRSQDQETKKLQNENERETRRERELLQEKNNSLNKEITRLTMLMSQYGDQRDNNKVDNSLLDRISTMETELDEVSRKYKASTTLLEERQDELRVQKDEIKLLKLTIDNYESKVNEQADLIDKLQRELTNVKGTLAVSLLDEIQHAVTPGPTPAHLEEKCPSIVLADDEVTNALRTIDEANETAELQRIATADSEARYYVALFDYQAPPHRDDQLSLKEGDVVIVLSEEESGFYVAEVEGRKGLVPVDYVGEFTSKHPGSAIPLEAYQRTSISEEDVLSPPLHPAAVWLPNSCVCITWVPPDMEDGKNGGITVAGYKVYVSGKEKTIVFGSETREVVLENMSDTSLGDIKIVTVGVDSQESSAAPITIPKPPQKAEILKAIQAQNSSADATSQYVVALYTYAPHQDSPNEFPELELAFLEGDIIKKVGDTMPDGFFRGELYGKTGLVPSNFVQLILEPGESLVDTVEDIGGPGSVNYPIQFIALYDYDPNTQSPNDNPETELAFREGDIIDITGPMDEDMYYPGEMNGAYGLVPSNFVSMIKEESRHVRRHDAQQLAREDSAEATIAALLSEAANTSNSRRGPVQRNNVPSSSELDVRNTLSVRTRWHQRYPSVF